VCQIPWLGQDSINQSLKIRVVVLAVNQCGNVSKFATPAVQILNSSRQTVLGRICIASQFYADREKDSKSIRISPASTMCLSVPRLAAASSTLPSSCVVEM
jgi:hypothetical protein